MKIYYLNLSNILKVLSTVLIIGVLSLMFIFNGKSILTSANFGTIFEGNKDHKVVALTFNVDWGEECILPLLDILKKENVRATFFITGRWAKNFPKHVSAIADGGNEIGNHGYYHKSHARIGFDESLKEIKETESKIYDICKKRTVLFAPPYGEKDEAVIKSAYAAGYRTVFWTIDTIDWRRPAPEYIINRVTQAGLTNGTIILMHPTDPTIRALPQIIKYIKDNGYAIRPISEIAGGY